MSPLADAVYAVLRTRTPSPHPEISYSDLVARLPKPYNALDPDSDLLATALGDVVRRCRARDLPALSAIVVRAREKIPGPGYYPVAHPNEAGDVPRAMIAWARELDGVKTTTYPATL
ncbi:hypothetical protein [Anaeromyxobacter sp. SG17]|uniref:hypothetical protein n=1 Tax=Anaeromyxobacter sp. SG17 TaxID=2925405 RepID=UPI001F5612D1|nr:hypothetical protein [Anaeromyxobacter sp. SG17]